MKPCRSTNSPRRPDGPNTPAMQGASTQPPVNRYCHPIRTKSSPCPGSTEDLLSYILDALAHQADLLEELLRRTQEKDTI